MKDQYFFGRTLARQIDFFAFPRTGSHFLRYCTQGLFDLVALPQPGTDEPEAVDRQRELQPLALYALDLREDGVPLSPVWFNARAAGRHGTPIKADAPVLLLIREPIATVYSFYRAATSRWGTTIDAPAAWLQDKFNRYADFYRAGLAITSAHPQHSLLLRFEDLVESPAALERLVAFVGVRPKLTPAFVHAATRFDAMVAPGARSFYRAGDNAAWQTDSEFRRTLERVQLPNAAEFGYPTSSAF